jgi:hypothetical protein
MRSGQSLFTLTGKGEGRTEALEIFIRSAFYGPSKDFGVNGLRLGVLVSQANPDLHVAMEANALLMNRWVAPCVDERVEGKDRDLPMQVSVSRL